MKKIAASIMITALFLALFGITFKIPIMPVVFSDQSVSHREVWKLLNVTNPTMSDLDVDVNVTVSPSRNGVHVACSINVTEYFENPTEYAEYKDWMEWLNGTDMLAYHWGDMNWHVSNGSLTPTTYDEIQHWGNMYLDTGNVQYWTFMGNTYMADCNLTRNVENPDIISIANETGNTIRIIDAPPFLRINASKKINMAFKIVITEPGISNFTLAATAGIELSETSWVMGGAKTLSVPYDYPKIQEAINAAAPGDTILVDEGTYSENLVIDKNITLQSSEGATATTINAADASDYVIKITADGVTVDGFTVTGRAEDADNAAAIYLYGVDNCAVKNNVLTDNYKDAINLMNIGGDYCDYNIISNNTVNGPDGRDTYGIKIKGSHNTISRNKIYNTNSPIHIWSWSGESETASPDYNIVSDNVIGPGDGTGGHKRGITLKTGHHNVITRNNITDVEWDAIQISAGGSRMENETDFDPRPASNTISDNIITGGEVGIALMEGARNHIVSGNKINGTTFVGIFGYEWVGIPPDWTLDSPSSFLQGTPQEYLRIVGNQITDNSISDCGRGIAMEYAHNNTVTGNTIEDNVGGETIIWHGNDITPYAPAGFSTGARGVYFDQNSEGNVVNSNNIVGNTGGLENGNSGVTLDATNNWWGNWTGPSPRGNGDAVSGNVTFEPWLIQPYPPAVQVSKIYIDPASTQYWTPAYGSTFTVSVKTNVVLLAGFQFNLTWDGTLLNLINATYSPPWRPFMETHQSNTTNSYCLALHGFTDSTPYPFNGSTTLTTLTLKAIYDPIFNEDVMCNLALEDVILAAPEENKTIPCLIYNGTYSCNSTKPKVALMPQETVAKKVPLQFDVEVNVTNIVNLCAFEFNLTYNPAIIEALTMKVEPFFDGSYSVAVQIIKNEKGFVFVRVNSISPPASGSGTLARITFKVGTSVVWPDPSLTCNLTFYDSKLLKVGDVEINHDTVDGTYRYDPIKGDLNMDGIVEFYDLFRTAQAFGLTSADSDWDPVADLIRDNVINILDIIVVANNIGRTS